MDYGGALSSHFQAKPGASKKKHVKFILGHGSVENQDSSDTLSPPSSDSSSSDDFFQVNPQILPKFTVQNKPPLSNGGTKSFFGNDEIDISSEALYRLEESINGSPGSTSQFSDITHESLMPQFSPPSIQIMEKNGGFDPHRIPISVFSKSSTPTEWSVASNDSLFSIRIGDSSFSRDRVLKIDIDLQKSGELLTSEQLSKSPRKSGEVTSLGPTSPSFRGIEPYFDIEKTIGVDEEINDDPTNNHADAVIRESRDSYGANSHFDKSEIRVLRFAKPRKKKSSSCSMCHCQDCCSQASYRCKWLNCSCKSLRWPSLSFKWCTKCFKCPICHCKCPNLSSCCCKCPTWSNCCCNCPNWSNCCCKFPNWSNCCCKFPNWSNCCCKFPNWSNCCCKFSNWSSLCCKCSSWSCCKCSSWSCSSWSCFKCSSWSCCKCSSWSCCKCSSWSCCKCSPWSCCKSRCSNCTWACCHCWNRKQKRSCYDSSIILTDGGLTNSKSSTNASSQGKCVCFSCWCCSCWSCSC